MGSGASHAISAAGLVLSASFAALALEWLAEWQTRCYTSARMT